jgi:DNA replication protein DnaC
MSIQHQRVVELCNELRLGGVAAQYTALAQKAAEKHTSFTDFVEELLSAERESRRARAREMFARIAGFPAIKTLDQYDFNFATGAPRKQIMELSARRTWCSSGPRAWARRIWRSPSGIWLRRRASRLASSAPRIWF